MRVYDKAECMNLVEYDLTCNGKRYLVELEISTNKVRDILDYEMYEGDLPGADIVVGTPEYNQVIAYLHDNMPAI